jgi:hypothetical protein
MAKITFGELLKLAQEINPNISSVYDESGTSELTTPKRPTGSSDPPTATWEVLMIPKKRRGTTRKDSSQNSSADPQQEELE